MNSNDFRKEMHLYIDEQYDIFTGIQQQIQEILKIFHDLCVKNNITYYVMYGSLLGLVRDDGFIPWDSDMDVVVPYRDALKLHDVLSTYLPEQFYFVSNYTDEDFPYFQMRICKKGISHDKLHLDIFYMIGMSDRNDSRTVKYKKDIKKLFFLRNMKSSYRELKLSRNMSINDLAHKLYYGLRTCCYSLKHLNKKFEKISNKYGYDDSEIVAVWGFTGFFYNKKDFEPAVLYQTGIGDLYIPNDYVSLLKETYGDYTEYLLINERFDEFSRQIKHYLR